MRYVASTAYCLKARKCLLQKLCHLKWVNEINWNCSHLKCKEDTICDGWHWLILVYKYAEFKKEMFIKNCIHMSVNPFFVFVGNVQKTAVSVGEAIFFLQIYCRQGHLSQCHWMEPSKWIIIVTQLTVGTQCNSITNLGTIDDMFHAKLLWFWLEK